MLQSWQAANVVCITVIADQLLLLLWLHDIVVADCQCYRQLRCQVDET